MEPACCYFWNVASRADVVGRAVGCGTSGHETAVARRRLSADLIDLPTCNQGRPAD